MSHTYSAGLRLVIALAVALLTVGCVDDDAPRSRGEAHAGPPAGSSHGTTTTPGETTSGNDTSGTAPTASTHAGHARAAARQPAEIRLLLEQLLGHHAVLMVRLMRGIVDGEPQFVAAADGALQRNTQALRTAVDAVYGEASAAAFAAMWDEHVTSLVSYSTAVAGDDRTGQEVALLDLRSYAAEYGQFINELSGGLLDAGAVTDDVSHHVDQMVAATDAYAAGDYAEAYALERQAYAAMFSTGRALSGAAVTGSTGELPAAFTSAPAELRSALGRLLGEHVELAFDATRAVVAGSGSAAFAAEALNQNTREVFGAMQAALGERTAQEFADVWADHIDALVQFSVAVAAKDATAQASARGVLDTFPRRLESVLPPAARDAVAANAVVAALREHDQQLLQQVTAYAAGDYVTSHELAYDGYEHMFAIADTLARALRGNTRGTAPQGGADTGVGPH